MLSNKNMLSHTRAAQPDPGESVSCPSTEWPLKSFSAAATGCPELHAHSLSWEQDEIKRIWHLCHGPELVTKSCSDTGGLYGFEQQPVLTMIACLSPALCHQPLTQPLSSSFLFMLQDMCWVHITRAPASDCDQGKSYFFSLCTGIHRDPRSCGLLSTDSSLARPEVENAYRTLQSCQDSEKCSRDGGGRRKRGLCPKANCPRKRKVLSILMGAKGESKEWLISRNHLGPRK